MEHFPIYFILLIYSWEILRPLECFGTVKVRGRRYLVYPPPGAGNAPTKMQLILGLGLPMEDGLIVGYVLKNNYNLPYNSTFFSDPYVRTQRSIFRADSPKSTVSNKGSMTRWETYKMFESAFDIFGSGKSCLLRAICEAAREPFNENHGLFGELLHVFLTPSTTAEEFLENEDQEYFAAELFGRRSPDECRKFLTDCETSPLEYFTESKD